MWTVEWVEPNGQKTLQNHCVESDSLDAQYNLLQTEKANTAKRRKHAEEDKIGTTGKRQRKTSNTDSADLPGSQATTTDAKPALHDDQPQPAASSENIESISQLQEAGSIDGDAPSEETNLTSAPLAQKPYFYLLKPSTASSQKVLIALDSTQTLTEALSHRAVLEFPTIYLLSQAPSELPPQFLSEQAYQELREKEEAELKKAVAQTEADGVGERPMPDSSGPQRLNASGPGAQNHDRSQSKPDPAKILEMLRRDLSSSV